MKAILLTAMPVAIALAGCATGSEAPLLFGSNKVFGVSIGGSATDTGGEFVVGYKGQDVAVVPVSTVASGDETFVGAIAPNGYQDSYSVLGQFHADTKKPKKGANAGLGKFFATGNAAQNLATGFKDKMGAKRTTVTECKAPVAPVAPPPAAGAAPAAPPPLPVARAAEKAKPAADARQRDGARMIFAQYDFKALAVDGSALETGLKFTLGYRSRNLAVIPVVGRDAQGNIVNLSGKAPPGFSDVLSVLGQFESDDSVIAEGGDKGTTISSGLETFFSTGAAARILSEGFQVKLCEEYSAPVQKPAALVSAGQ